MQLGGVCGPLVPAQSGGDTGRGCFELPGALLSGEDIEAGCRNCQEKRFDEMTRTREKESVTAEQRTLKDRPQTWKEGTMAQRDPSIALSAKCSANEAPRFATAGSPPCHVLPPLLHVILSARPVVEAWRVY